MPNTFNVGDRVVQLNNPNGIRGTVINCPYPFAPVQAPVPGLKIPAEADLVWTQFDNTSVPTTNPYYGLLKVTS